MLDVGEVGLKDPEDDNEQRHPHHRLSRRWGGNFVIFHLLPRWDLRHDMATASAIRISVSNHLFLRRNDQRLLCLCAILVELSVRSSFTRIILLIVAFSLLRVKIIHSGVPIDAVHEQVNLLTTLLV